MKQTTRYIFALAAMFLLTIGTMADNTAIVIKQINGSAAGTTNPGEVTYSNGTITVTPTDGYYLKASDLTVVKIIDSQNAEARRRSPGINNTIAVTATDVSADPSGVTTYTFTVTDTKYDYEITANFHSRTNIAGATVTVVPNTYTYNGSAITPTLTVSYGNAALASNYYAISYQKNDNGTLTDVAEMKDAGAYKIVLTGKREYMGSKSINFTISKAAATVSAPTAKTLTYTGSAQELVNVGSATGGTIEYSLDGTNYGTAIPKGKDAKTYTVYYRVTGDANHNGVAAASIRVTISKAVGSISYATTVINKTSIEAAFTNKLSLTGDGTVTYASSNPAVATVDAAGKVSIKGVGQTVITATVADGTNYTYNPNKATYTLKVASATMTVTTSGYTGAYDGAAHGITVTAPAGATVMYGETEGTYNLNASPTYTNVGTYIVYYQVTKTNFTTVKGSATVTINKADVKVLYEDDQFTVKKGDTFEPPHLTLDPADLPISYRSSDPEVATVDDQTGEVTTLSLGETLIYAEFVGDDNRNPASACYLLTVVQRDIEPIDEDVVIVWKDEDFFYTNDEGEKEEVKLTNIVLYDILFTLNVTGDPSESDGYDETEHGIVLNTPMSLRNAYYAITQGHEPGSDEYAEEFTGLTFKVPAGTGYVIIDSRTDGKHQMMVNIGSLPPVAINHKDRDKDSIFYECSVPTWVYVYNGGEVSGARMNAIPKAKKTKGHVIIYSVTRTSQKNVAGIEQINSDAFDETERWYDLQGNRINRPTKKGIYILGGQKVIVQ